MRSLCILNFVFLTNAAIISVKDLSFSLTTYCLATVYEYGICTSIITNMYCICNNVEVCWLKYSNIVKVSLWTLGDCDGISQYCQNISKPDNQSIDGGNNQQIHLE